MVGILIILVVKYFFLEAVVLSASLLLSIGTNLLIGLWVCGCKFAHRTVGL